jgi:hypothetical protein
MIHLLVMLMLLAGVLAACSSSEEGGGVAQAPVTDIGQAGGNPGTSSNSKNGDPEVGSGRVTVVSPSIIGSENQGEASGGAPAGAPNDENSAAPAAPVVWQAYTDSKNAFTLQYPSAYVILPPKAEKTFPSVDREIYFQDKGIATSDVAEFAPPAFGVRVFTNPDNLNAAQWLVKNEFMSADSAKALKNIVIDSVAGVSNCTMQDIAPNCFRYFAFKGQIYELSPNGEYSLPMLESFKFIK